MARRRTLIRIPFLKFKINKQTIFNICGFIFIGISFVFLISYLKNFLPGSDGRLLFQINKTLTRVFGGLAILLPFILLLFSGHFFNTKKLKFVKLNISGGLVLVFIALLGIFQSGEIGKLIFHNLSLDFSLIGAIAIFGTIFFVGLILLLDTSIDVFLLFIMNLTKSGFNFLKASINFSVADKSLKREEKIQSTKQEFIKEESQL